jgi:DNA-binding response OmpR family regulator
VWGDLSIDLLSMEVKRKERQIPLNRKEFYLLKYLLEHAGMVVRRDAIMDEVWGETAEVRSNTLEVHVKRLRRKLDEPFSSHMIQTVHGVGYKLALDE